MVCGCTLLSTLFNMQLTPLLLGSLISIFSLLQSMQPECVLRRTEGLTTGGPIFTYISLGSDGVVHPKGLISMHNTFK